MFTMVETSCERGVPEDVRVVGLRALSTYSK